jgi:hypothetical protein
MRTWGRKFVGGGGYSSAIGEFTIGLSPIGVQVTNPYDYDWVEVKTDANGYNDAVWLTTLAQVLQLGLNESPIFGNYGIPAQQTVVTQVLPDYYVNLTQQLFAAYFLALIVTKLSDTEPRYTINATANPGAILMSPVPI